MPDIDFGRISESLNEKSDRDLRNVDTTAKADAVIDYQEPTSANNYTWYRKYKSGWVEQGGYYYAGTSVAGAHNISFPVPFANINYQSLLSVLHDSDGGSPNDISEVFPSRTTTTMRIYVRAGWCGYVWRVSGMAA